MAGGVAGAAAGAVEDADEGKDGNEIKVNGGRNGQNDGAGGEGEEEEGEEEEGEEKSVGAGGDSRTPLSVNVLGTPTPLPSSSLPSPPSTPVVIADVALKGFLFKQRDVFKTWRKRYGNRL